MPKATLGVVIERIDNFKSDMRTDLGRIEAQTVRTNGRVTALEDQAVKDKILESKIKLILWIIGSILTILITGVGIPLLYKFFETKLF